MFWVSRTCPFLRCAWWCLVLRPSRSGCDRRGGGAWVAHADSQSHRARPSDGEFTRCGVRGHAACSPLTTHPPFLYVPHRHGHGDGPKLRADGGVEVSRVEVESTRGRFSRCGLQTQLRLCKRPNHSPTNTNALDGIVAILASCDSHPGDQPRGSGAVCRRRLSAARERREREREREREKSGTHLLP